MNCPCYKCCEERDRSKPLSVELGHDQWMANFNARETNKFIVCPKCGNKRCPHASDHAFECTQSNEPGQVGSRYQ